MTEQQQQMELVDGAFQWPASILPSRSDTETFTQHIPSGWSSNDVIQVSVLSPAHSRRFIVKLPRHGTSPCIAASCKAEAIRTCWAAEHGFGPKVLAIDEESGGFIMEFIEGRTLTVETIRQHLPQAVKLLRRIHEAEAMNWMRRYDPIDAVREHLKRVKESKAMRREDVRFIGGILRDTGEEVKDHPWSPCHNDFHSHNVMLTRSSRGDSESLLAIDFEDCNLGDPMWDLAYLTVNLELEQETYVLEYLYEASAEERRRVRAYVPLAMAHCATWAALHGGVWAQHQEEVMVRLRAVVGRLS